MLSRFYYSLTGTRHPSPNSLNDYAQLLIWEHSDYLPAKHIALAIHYEGKQHYLSFSPAELGGLSKRPLLEQRDGVTPYFIENREEELLIQGFRNDWPNLQSLLNQDQKTLLNGRNLKIVSASEIVSIAKLFSAYQQKMIKEKGHPHQIETLRDLDLEKMIEMIQGFKSNSSIKWASWCGTYFRKPGRHNCASMVLDVLYKGGLGHHLSSPHDILGAASMLVGASMAFYNNDTWINAILNLIEGLIIGRGLGSAYEGYVGIQSFLNLMSASGESQLSATLGLRFLSTTLSSFIGVIKPGPLVPAFLTLPQDVVALVQEAKINEEAIFESPKLRNAISLGQ